MLSNNAGIYTEDDSQIKKYYKSYDKAIKNSDILAYFPSINSQTQESQKYYTLKYGLNIIKIKFIIINLNYII